MPPGRLILFCTLLEAALHLAAAPLPRGGDLGRRWKAREWTSAYNLEGVWVRRGDSNEFDVSYTDAKTRQQLFWRVAILSIDGAQVRMKATLNLNGKPQTFDVTGRLLTDGRTIRGRGGWCKPTVNYCGFEVVTDWPVAAPALRSSRPIPPPAPAPSSGSTSTTPPPAPAAASLKALPLRWRVKDNTTPGFHYQGSWVVQGAEIRFHYTETAGNARADGAIAIDSWDGALLILHDRAARRVYRGALQPDGKTISGDARPCPPKIACTWEATAEK